MNADGFDTEEIKTHVKSRHTWLRLLYIVIFLFFAWVASFVFMVVILVLFLWQLLAGSPNEQVRKFGQDLSTWGYQVLSFLSFNSDDLPFPFDSWPSGPPKGGSGGSTRSRKKASKKKKKVPGSSTSSSGSADSGSGA